MFSSSDLFQFRDAFRELLKTSVGVKDGKMEVNFSRANSANTPLCIMIPKHLVPVVKRLRGENFRRVQKRPITPKWAMYTIDMIDHGLLNICVKVPRIGHFLNHDKLLQSHRCSAWQMSKCIAKEVLPATPANTTASCVSTMYTVRGV